MFRIKKTVFCTFVLIFLGFNFVTAGTDQEVPQNITTQENEASIPYRIEKGDELEVRSIQNPEINASLVVRPDGKISMPLAAEIPAVGKTPEELAALLSEKYSVEFKDPSIAVIVKTFSGHRVFVGGEVRKPGTFSLTGPLTVLQAISQAEGFTNAAKISDVIVIRRGPKNEPTTTVVDLKKAMKGTDPRQDMQLVPYDIVYVPRSKIADVKGFFNNVVRAAIPVPW